MPNVKTMLKDWGWGDWPKRIAKTAKNKKVTVTIEPSPELFESTVKAVGIEILKAFFRDTDIFMSTKGVEISGINGEREVIYSWKECSLLAGEENYEAVKKWLENENSVINKGE